METIDRNELKSKLERSDDFKLVMVLGNWHFMAKRIPGSINVPTPQDALKILNPEDEIVVYCSSQECVASQMAYHVLVKNGYKNVKRYSGGINDWEEAGFILEGEMIKN